MRDQYFKELAAARPAGGIETATEKVKHSSASTVSDIATSNPMLKKAVEDDPFASDEETRTGPTVKQPVHQSRKGAAQGVDEGNIVDNGNKDLDEDEEAQERIAKLAALKSKGSRSAPKDARKRVKADDAGDPAVEEAEERPKKKRGGNRSL